APLRDPLEEAAGQHRRPEGAHVDGENLVKRVELIGAEAGLEPFLLWAADLSAELRVEPLPQSAGRVGEIEAQRDLARRHTQRCRQELARAQVAGQGLARAELE